MADQTQQDKQEQYTGEDRRSQSVIDSSFWPQVVGGQASETDYAPVLAQRALFTQLQQQLTTAALAAQQAQTVSEVAMIQQLEQRIEQNVIRRLLPQFAAAAQPKPGDPSMR